MLDAHVVKARPPFVVDVELRVERGEACGIFGASGAGKSTVLAILAGLERPDAGHVRLDERTFFPPFVAPEARGVGLLSQDAALFPHLCVARNVTFGVAPNEAAEREPWIGELRERLGLAPLWLQSPRTLSGGQARRVALARTLARRPALLLLDEPFTGLDRDLVRDLLDAVRAWRERLGFALVAVDHDPDVLERLAGRAIVMQRGRAVADAPWTQIRRSPPTPDVARSIAPL